MVNYKISCPHNNCKQDHKIKIDLPEQKDTCGVYGCNHIAQTKVRLGFVFYKVCTIHAQGHEITKEPNEDYGA